MFVWVHRTSGVIDEIHARHQPGHATERLPDTDPEVVAFLTPTVPNIDDLIDAMASNPGAQRGLIGAIADLTSNTSAAVVAAMKRNA